jgi:hypothetical protein
MSFARSFGLRCIETYGVVGRRAGILDPRTSSTTLTMSTHAGNQQCGEGGGREEAKRRDDEAGPGEQAGKRRHVVGTRGG